MLLPEELELEPLEELFLLVLLEELLLLFLLELLLELPLLELLVVELVGLPAGVDEAAASGSGVFVVSGCPLGLTVSDTAGDGSTEGEGLAVVSSVGAEQAVKLSAVSRASAMAMGFCFNVIPLSLFYRYIPPFIIVNILGIVNKLGMI